MRIYNQCKHCINFLGSANRKSDHWSQFLPVCSKEHYPINTKKYGLARINCKDYSFTITCDIDEAKVVCEMGIYTPENSCGLTIGIDI